MRRMAIGSFLVFLGLILLPYALSAQTIDWEQNHGGSDAERGYEVEAFPGGGYVTVGFASSSDQDLNGNQGGMDVWVTRVDSSGTLEWQKNLGGSNSDIGRSITITPDSAILIAASSRSSDGDLSGNQGEEDFWVVKLDSNGTLLWKETFGGSGRDIPYSIVNAVNGGYLLLGSSGSSNGDLSGNHGGTDHWVVKIDETGSIEWKEHYGGTSDETGRKILRPSNGGYLLIGQSKSDSVDLSGNYGQNDFWALKIDTNGTIEWKGHYGGNFDEKAYDGVENAKGNYYLAGYTDSDTGLEDPKIGVQDVWIIEIDTNGNLLMEERYGGSYTDEMYSIVALPSSGFIAAGTAEYGDHQVSNAFDPNGYDYDQWVIRCDSTGKLVSEHSFGGTDDDRAEDLIRSSSGDLVIVGSSQSSNFDVSDNNGWDDQWIYEIERSCSSAQVDRNPQDTYGCIGDTVKFRAQPPLFGCVDSFRWQRNTGSGWNDLNSGNEDTILVNEVQLSQSGYQYRCILSDSSGNRDTSSGAELIVPDPMSIDTKVNEVLCHGESSGSIEVDVSTGLAPFEVSTDSGAYFGPHFDSTYTVGSLDSGSYHLQVRDSIGCRSNIITDTVTEPPELVASAGSDDSLCAGDSVRVGSSPAATGGSGSYSISWQPSSSLSSSTIDTPKAAPSQTETYTLTVTDTNACQDSDQMTVELFDPKVELGNDTGICYPDSSTLLSADTDLNSYLWSTGATSSSLMVTSPGTYWVEVSDSNSCFDVDSVEVLIDSTTSGKIHAKDTGFFCSSSRPQVLEADQVNVQPGIPQFQWWTPDGQIASFNTDLDSVRIEEAGTYFLQIEDSITGCSTEDSLVFNGDTLKPKALIQGDSTLNGSDDTAILDGSYSVPRIGPLSYNWWSPIGGEILSDDTMPQLKVGAAAYYILEVIDEGTGCSDIDSIYVTGPSSVQSKELEELEAYPDPTSGPLTVRSDQKLGEGQLLVYDVQGRLQQKKSFQNERSIRIRLKGNNGLYLIEIRTSKGIRVLKVIKE